MSVSKEFRDNIGAKLRDRSRGAGDQGVMVGYACDDTPVSYTHLDVYKRQEGMGEISKCSRRAEKPVSGSGNSGKRG